MLVLEGITRGLTQRSIPALIIQGPGKRTKFSWNPPY